MYLLSIIVRYIGHALHFHSEILADKKMNKNPDHLRSDHEMRVPVEMMIFRKFSPPAGMTTNDSFV